MAQFSYSPLALSMRLCTYVHRNRIEQFHVINHMTQMCVLDKGTSKVEALFRPCLKMPGWTDAATKALLAIWGEQTIQQQLDAL